jgi:hypothetical protein
VRSEADWHPKLMDLASVGSIFGVETLLIWLSIRKALDLQPDSYERIPKSIREVRSYLAPLTRFRLRTLSSSILRWKSLKISGLDRGFPISGRRSAETGLITRAARPYDGFESHSLRHEEAITY